MSLSVFILSQFNILSFHASFLVRTEILLIPDWERFLILLGI